MKKKLHYFKLLLLLFGIIPSMHSQWQNGLWTEKQAYNWCFGEHIGLEFSTGNPLPFPNAQLIGPEGSTVISDASGQLLFYAGGTGNTRADKPAIWNKNHELMVNGTDLNADPSSTQFGVFVQKPNNPDFYYLFQISRLEGKGLLYSEIDMTLDGGNGAVTDNKNILLDANARVEKITAVYHANGKDIWVISHLFGSDEFIAYLVTETGISAMPVISAVGLSYSEINYADITAYAVGQLKVSPDGKKLAAVLFGAFAGDTGIEVFDFNNETGEISNPIFLTEIFLNPVYGVEFSPNSRYLYGSEYINMFTPDVRILQLDLAAGDAAAINNSATAIASFSDGNAFAAMQLAPDGKIYYEISLGSLGAINYPNNAGIAAGASAIDLGGEGTYRFGLPTFIQSYFASGILYEGSRCFGEEITFDTLRIPGITSITWDFGDPNSGTANTSSEPVHVFSGPGIYIVTANITSNGAIQTTTTEITIIEGPKAIVPAVELLTKCADANGNAVFNLSEFSATILDGQDTNIFSLAYYATEADRLANDPIADLSNFTTAGQTIYAVVTNLETGCTTVLPLNLVVNLLPALIALEVLEQCGDFSGNAIFNLKEQDTAILAGRNPNDFTIVYFTDAGGTNAITEPQNFISSGQSIYVFLTNNATGCYVITSFDLIVIPVGQLPGNLRIDDCSPFDLTTIAGSLEVGLNLSFFTTEEDAIAGNNVITDPQKYNITANSVTVYIVAENAQGCLSFGKLLLQTAGCIIPKGISPNGDGMNDAFDLSSFDVKHLAIFNRYGQEVYTQKNYTNQWYGQGSNGDELPTGTYYYMIQLTDSEKKTGWVYINRMN